MDEPTVLEVAPSTSALLSAVPTVSPGRAETKRWQNAYVKIVCVNNYAVAETAEMADTSIETNTRYKH